jgi:hypothetical protein
MTRPETLDPVPDASLTADFCGFDIASRQAADFVSVATTSGSCRKDFTTKSGP